MQVKYYIHKKRKPNTQIKNPEIELHLKMKLFFIGENNIIEKI